METKFFFPFKPENLGLYFNTAIICPTNYIKKRSPDIQNSYENHLLFSNKVWTENENCSLEIVLTEEEKEDLIKLNENFFIFPKPLPISRVKRIYFNSNEQRKVSVGMANTNAFVPEKLVKVIEKSEFLIFDFEKKEDFVTTNWSEFLEKYNKILGGLVFMKSSDGNFKNYSDNYFSTISYFNQYFEKIYIDTFKYSIDKKFHGIFEKNDDWKVFYEIIFENKNIEDSINEILNKRNLTLKKEIGIYDIDNISDNTLYVLAVLNDYGHIAKRKTSDDLFSNIITGKIKKQEGLSLLYGLLNGYSGFRNKYSFCPNKNIKFEFKTKLDYITIESIYQFVFFNKKSNDCFEFITNWCPFPIIPKLIPNYDIYVFLDESVIKSKKQNQNELDIEVELLETEIIDFINTNEISNFSDFINNFKSSINKIKSLFTLDKPKLPNEKVTNDTKEMVPTGNNISELFKLPTNITMSYLKNKNKIELKKIATELKIKISSNNSKKEDIIKLIMEKNHNV